MLDMPQGTFSTISISTISNKIEYELSNKIVSEGGKIADLLMSRHQNRSISRLGSVKQQLGELVLRTEVKLGIKLE